MIIGQNAFTGFAPRNPPHLAGETSSDEATNCDFSHGELRALATNHVSDTLPDIGPIVSIFADRTPADTTNDGRVWYSASFPAETYMVRGPVTDDVHHRYYFTQDTGGIRVVNHGNTPPPKHDYNPSSYRVGVPQLPESCLTVSALTNYARKALDHLDFDWTVFYEIEGKINRERNLTLITPNWVEADGVVTAGEWLAFTATIDLPDGLTFKKSNTIIYGWIKDGVKHKIEDAWPGYYSAAANVISTTKIEVCSPIDGSVALVVDATDSISVIVEGGVEMTLTALVQKMLGYQGLTGLDKPHVHLVGTDRNSNTEVFSLYSNGSSFTVQNNTGLIPGGVSLDMAPVPDTTNQYTIRLKMSPIEKRYYVVTVVNQFDEESAPTLSQSIELNFFQDAMVSVSAAYSVVADYVPPKAMRVYRSSADGQGNAAFLLVLDSELEGDKATWSFDGGSHTLNFTFKDHKKPEELGYALPTDAEYEPAPADIKGLCAMRTGVLAAFSGNSVHFCAPYRPAVWRISRASSLPYALMALHPFANGLVAFTRKSAFFFSGDGDNLANQEIVGTYGQVLNPRAIVETELGLVFATDDGICVTDGVKATMDLSLKFWTRNDWKAFIEGDGSSTYENRASRLRLGWWDSKLFMYFVSESDSGVVVSFDEAGGAMTYVTGLGDIRCHQRLSFPDGMWYINDKTMTLLFGGDGFRALSLRSRVWELPQPVSMAAMQVRQVGTSTVEVYADDALVHTATVTGNEIVRLPAGFEAHRWQYVIRRDAQEGAVRSVHMATSVAELKSV